eukprot:358314-Heterocapsa_arctica.AAC.1
MHGFVPGCLLRPWSIIVCWGSGLWSTDKLQHYSTLAVAEFQLKQTNSGCGRSTNKFQHDTTQALVVFQFRQLNLAV